MSVPDANPHCVGLTRAVCRPETVRLYAAEWSAFVAWCRDVKRISFPADAETLAAYLLAVAPGVSRGTVGRNWAAVRAMHRQHGLELPALDPHARAAVRSAEARNCRLLRPPCVTLDHQRLGCSWPFIAPVISPDLATARCCCSWPVRSSPAKRRLGYNANRFASPRPAPTFDCLGPCWRSYWSCATPLLHVRCGPWRTGSGLRRAGRCRSTCLTIGDRTLSSELDTAGERAVHK